MKTYSIVVTAMFVLLSTVCIGLAQEEKATKEDCMNLAKDAAAMMSDEGLEATLEKTNDKNGPFCS